MFKLATVRDCTYEKKDARWACLVKVSKPSCYSVETGNGILSQNIQFVIGTKRPSAIISVYTIAPS
jgi:hypothetical protein